MKSLKLYGIRDIRFEESEEPKIKKGNEVKVKIHSAGICGSDIHRYGKLGPYISGNIWGHEFSGIISEIGKEVKNFKIGDKVTVCPAIYCGKCESCKKGIFSQCNNLSVLGAYEPGGFAEYIVISGKHVIKLPDDFGLDNAAMIEPSSIVVHGLYKTDIKPGDSVAVIGCGTIGLLAINWAKIFGATQIIAIDIDEKKLKLAKEFGATNTINSRMIEPDKLLYEVTNGKGVDLAIESAGSTITSSQVFALPGKGGKVLFLGIPYGDVTISRYFFEKIVRNELKVFGSWNGISAPFPGKEWFTTIEFIRNGELSINKLISHRLPLEKGKEAFELAIERKEDFCKIILHP